MSDLRLHGHPHPATFIKRYFIDAQGIGLDDTVTRIEWRYVCGSGFCECGGCVL